MCFLTIMFNLQISCPFTMELILLQEIPNLSQKNMLTIQLIFGAVLPFLELIIVGLESIHLLEQICMFKMMFLWVQSYPLLATPL